MNEQLDPEEVKGIMSRIKEEAVRIVESYGGIVNLIFKFCRSTPPFKW